MLLSKITPTSELFLTLMLTEQAALMKTEQRLTATALLRSLRLLHLRAMRAERLLPTASPQRVLQTSLTISSAVSITAISEDTAMLSMNSSVSTARGPTVRLPLKPPAMLLSEKTIISMTVLILSQKLLSKWHRWAKKA